MHFPGVKGANIDKKVHIRPVNSYLLNNHVESSLHLAIVLKLCMLDSALKVICTHM